MGRLRRCTNRLRLRGENAAMPVSLLLQSLLKSLSRPLATFRHHFHLDLPQRPRPLMLSVHPFPLVNVFALAG
jgi:hypothetical protein